MEKVSGLGDLGPLMPGLASSCNMDVILTLDNFVHRLCGVQQVYEIQMLFGEILNNVFFRDTPFIVFFNKVDLFEEKLKTASLTIAYKEYTGTQDFKEAL